MRTNGKAAVSAGMLLLLVGGLGCEGVFGPELDLLTSGDLTYLPLAAGATWTYRAPGGGNQTATVISGPSGAERVFVLSGDGDVFLAGQKQYRLRDSGLCRVFEFYIQTVQQTFDWLPFLCLPASGEFWELTKGTSVRWSAPYMRAELLVTRETVSVPAGTFAECAVCEVRTTASIGGVHYLERYYLAPDVGIVKYTVQEGAGPVATYELESYAIPK